MEMQNINSCLRQADKSLKSVNGIVVHQPVPEFSVFRIPE